MKRMMNLSGFVCFFIFAAMAALLLPARAAQPEELNTECTQEILKTVVHSVGVTLSESLKQIPEEQKRIELIQSVVKPIRFFPDQSGYLYVYTLDGLVIGHGGMKNLEGTNLFDHQDTKGTYDVRLAIETAKKGGGFFEHYWKKPGAEGEFRKITYVEPVGETYFIGAGAYLP